MYLSKTKKRNIIIFVLILLCSTAVAAFLLLQKPKIEMVQIAGSGYTGTELSISVLPLESTVTYQWEVALAPGTDFVNLAGATSRTLLLNSDDVGKYYKAIVRGSSNYAGKLETAVFGPIKGISVSWPKSTPITYGQALSSSSLGEGSALINGIFVPGSFSFKTPALIPANAGLYKAEVTFTPSDLVMYKAITSLVEVTVNKALLTVTIANKAVVYGNLISAYSYTISGFLQTDTLSAVSGTPAITSVYSPGLAVSWNPVQIIGELGTLSSSNYDFTFIFGNITITKRVLSITGLAGGNKFYDGSTIATASGTARLSGIFPGDDVSLGGRGYFNFVTKNVGNNIRITTKGYVLKGTKAANYSLIMPTLYGDIKPVIVPTSIP